MMKRGGILVVATALVALTGCSAPAGEAPVATVTVTATPTESASPATTKANAPAPATAPSSVDKEALYLEGVRMVMPAYGFPEYKLSDEKILAEGKKICEQGDDYKGDPQLNKKTGATKALVFEAEFKLC